MSAITSRPPGRNTRTASLIAFSRPARPLMLWIARLERTRSKLLSSKGSAVMSALCNSTRSATPSARALRRVASAELPDWSTLRHRSAPQAHAHRPTGGQVLGGHEKHCPAAAAHVQDSLVTAQVQPVKYFGPNQEFAAERGVEVEPENRQDEQGGQPCRHLTSDDGQE